MATAFQRPLLTAHSAFCIRQGLKKQNRREPREARGELKELSERVLPDPYLYR